MLVEAPHYFPLLVYFLLDFARLIEYIGGRKEGHMLAEKLRKYRLHEDLSYRELAGKTGLAVETLRRIERGEKVFERTQYKLEQFLGAHIESEQLP